MKKYVSSAVLSLLASISFGVANASPAQEVNRQIAPGTGNTASNDMTRRADEIQNLIERSEEAYRKAESFFKSGEYGQARRSYDESIDILLGSGYDVRREARLRDQYHSLIDRINQRQSQIAAMLQGPRPLVASEKDEFTDSQLAAQDKNAGKFGQRQEKGYVESPLDEVAKVNLTDEERRATDEEARAAFSAAKVDFGFRPNALVQSWINYYQGRGKATMETGLRRAGRYVSRARKIFKEEGVPQDLVWLGQVESAWLPQARSWASAVGLWQFVPATGARFGLYQDYYIDERSSFEKATRASARYLKWLANRYAGNWELAMAAYNSGEGNVDRAIARSGYADFWEIYQRGLLPNETRNYVPNILATIIIAKNPERYGFTPKPDPPMVYDTVMVNNAVDLRLAAEACDTSIDYLLDLNPELKRGATPQGMLYGLRVPSGRGKNLQTWLTRIPPDKRNTWRLLRAQDGDTLEGIAKRHGVSESVLLAVNGGVEPKSGQKFILPVGTNLRTVAAVAPKGAMTTGATASAPSGGYSKVIVYTVKANETINDIAARYGSSVKDIAALNRISVSAPLRAGQMLKVPTRGK